MSAPERPPHLGAEWDALTVDERAEVLAWARGDGVVERLTRERDDYDRQASQAVLAADRWRGEYDRVVAEAAASRGCDHERAARELARTIAATPEQARALVEALARADTTTEWGVLCTDAPDAVVEASGLAHARRVLEHQASGPCTAEHRIVQRQVTAWTVPTGQEGDR